MLIYKAEREAGLEQKLQGRTLAYTSLARLANARPPEKDNLDKAIAKADKLTDKALATNLRQPDLYYLNSILASSVWNENDDVFDRAELWSAKDTPEDKPFNYNHQQDDIIGHITGNFAVTEAGIVIPHSSSVDDLPDLYHIVTSAVLYKVWEDESLQTRMNQIMEDIPKGGWFVSMECLFNQFDYAVRKPGEEGITVLLRAENTAFLTKHLRAYGGEGVYEGMQVGRLLRNFTFSGKGLVKEPANPSSVILSGKSSKTKTNAPQIPKVDVACSKTGYAPNKGEIIMADSAAQNDAEKRVADLTAKCEKLEASLRENESKNWAKQVETLSVALKEAQDKVNTEVKSVADLKQRLDEVGKAHQVSASSLAKLETEVRQAKRLSLASKKLGIDEARATKLVETMAALDDAAFATLIQAQADMLMEKGATNPGAEPKSAGTLPGMDAPAAPKNLVVNLGSTMDDGTECKKGKSGDKTDEDDTKDKKTKAEDDSEDDSEAALAGILDRAKPKKSVALASTDLDEGTRSLQADVLRFFGHKIEGEK